MGCTRSPFSGGLQCCAFCTGPVNPDVMHLMNAVVLTRLPRTRENVVHLHMGTPNPGCEGAILQCSVDSKGLWYANAQTGSGYADELTYWERANAYIWIAKGAVYLVRLDQAYSWRYFDHLGISCHITDDQKNAIIATYTDLICLDSAGCVSWQKQIAIDGIEILESCERYIKCSACYDPPDGWHGCRLNRQDGSDA